MTCSEYIMPAVGLLPQMHTEIQGNASLYEFGRGQCDVDKDTRGSHQQKRYSADVTSASTLFFISVILQSSNLAGSPVVIWNWPSF